MHMRTFHDQFYSSHSARRRLFGGMEKTKPVPMELLVILIFDQVEQDCGAEDGVWSRDLSTAP